MISSRMLISSRVTSFPQTLQKWRIFFPPCSSVLLTPPHLVYGVLGATSRIFSHLWSRPSFSFVKCIILTLLYPYQEIWRGNCICGTNSLDVDRILVCIYTNMGGRKRHNSLLSSYLCVGSLLIYVLLSSLGLIKCSFIRFSIVYFDRLLVKFRSVPR